MVPESRFRQQPMEFWANVRTIGQQVGYTVRGKGTIRVPTLEEIQAAFEKINLGVVHLINGSGSPTPLGMNILNYLNYRAKILNEVVETQLMDVGQAKSEFERLHADLQPTCPLPKNKQKGDKKAYAYFTAIINMLIENNASGIPCDYDPQRLTTVTRNGAPLRTLARRVDGAFPNTVNPVAIWEIKEYYYTTTFGSRIADGVYETLLDGMELEELQEHEGIDVQHVLMIDSHRTWWLKGKPYLCRIIDMLHMGYVDEVLFGREVMERLPTLVCEWAARCRSHAD